MALGLAAAGDPLALAPRLEPGAPVERALAGGESHRYRVRLGSGEGWRLAVEELGIDVALSVQGPGLAGALVADSPLARRGTQALVVRPEEPSTFQAEVRAKASAVSSGRYRLTLEPLPEATARQRAVLAAEEQAARAAAAYGRGGAGAGDEAATAYRRALEGWRSLDFQEREAETLHALASLSRQAGRTDEALDLYRRALDLWQVLGETGWEAAAASDLGLTHWQRGELDEAEVSSGRALELYRSLEERFGEAEALNNRCLVLHSRGRLRQALSCYREALQIFRDLGEAREEAIALNNLGFARYSLGEPEEARQAYEASLALRRDLGDRRGEAQSLNNLAVLFRSLGEHEEALARYQESRAILDGLDDPRQEASLLNNLGVTYQTLGEPERARVYFEDALELRRRTGDRRGQVITLNNLGSLLRASGEAEQALALHQRALELAREMGDRRNEGLTLSYLGEARSATGNPTLALEELARGAALLDTVGDRFQEAVALQRLGETLLAQGRPAEARERLGRGLALRRSLGDRAGEINTLTALARAELDLGEPASARADAEAAVALTENLRGRVVSPGLRSSFLGSRHRAYEVLIDVLATLHRAEPAAGFDRLALEVSETARARTLLDLLAEGGGTEIRRGVDPGLAARRERLLDRLQLKADRQLDFRRRGGEESEEARGLEPEIQEVLSRLDLVEAEIRRTSPRFADLVAPRPVTSGEIQDLLGPQTVLLEYALGEEQSHLWAVTESAVTFVPLLPRSELEDAVRRLYRELSTPPGGAELGGREAAALSRILLGPVQEALAEHRLAVVADGALHLLPFGVLPLPGEQSGETPTPLLARHEVVELPSASVLASQRRHLAGGPQAPELALVVADPVFDPRDPRLLAAAGDGQRRAAVATATRKESAETAVAAGLGPFERLAFSRLEAQAIAAQAPGRVVARLGVDAALPALLQEDLRRFRFLHFATHGVLDARRPALSRLVFSLVDGDGRRRDGFLRLADVYNLELAAEVVVLSGCRTALGREVRGEGLVGLTRGFLYAGARRVVASLWWVDDRATAELMERFYHGMWTQGLAPAAALRQAQLSLMAERRWQHPFYWAPFVLQGDWR